MEREEVVLLSGAPGIVPALLALFLLSPTVGLAQSADAEDLRNGAPKINTTFEDLSEETGFGVILREAGDTLYVVTARHVVDNGYQSDIARMVVSFADGGPTVEGRFVRLDDVWDLALVTVPKPAGFQWKFREAIGTAEVGTRVGVVGRDGSWSPTADPVAGAISSVEGGEITADFAGAEPGVSGGPLVADGGIVGVTFLDDGNVVTAYHIDNVLDLVLRNWLGVEELEPPDYPFLAMSGTTGFSVAATGLQASSTNFPPLGFGGALDLALSPVFGVGFEVERATTQSGNFDDISSGRNWEYENRMLRYGGHLGFHGSRFRGTGGYVALGTSRLEIDPRLRIDGGPYRPLSEVEGAMPVSSDRAWAFYVAAGLNRIWPSSVLAGMEMRINYATTPYMGITIQDPFAEQTGRDWSFDLRFRLGWVLRPGRSDIRILR